MLAIKPEYGKKICVFFCVVVYLRLTLVGGYGITDSGVKWGGVSSRTRSICRFGSS